MIRDVNVNRVRSKNDIPERANQSDGISFFHVLFWSEDEL